jgi:hypothetical protein
MPHHLRLVAAILCCVGAASCAASRQEVAARLGAEYIGQKVDTLVVKFGPPNGTFKLSNGQTSYQWQLGNHTDIAVNRYGYGSGSTRYCKVTVIASPNGTITQLDTEDSNTGDFGLAGSICARRLGMQREQS